MPKTILRWFFHISIPCVWFVSMWMLAGHTDEIKGRLNIEEIFGNAPEMADEQCWAGIYLKDKKIGYSYQSYQNSDKGVLYKEYMKMRIPLGGAVREIEADNFALLDSTLGIRSFSAGMSSGDYDVTIHGLVNDGSLEITYITGGKSNTRSLPLDGTLYFQGQVPRLIKLSGFKAGAFTVPIFDPLSMNISDLSVDVGQVSVDDEDSIYSVGLEMSGITTKMTIDSEGNLLKDEQPGGMMVVSETREEALVLKDVYSADEDFLVLLSVPSNVTIENDRQTNYLRAELQGIDPQKYMLEDSCTQMLVTKDPLVVQIDRRSPRHIKVAELDEFLSPTEFVQSEDPSIVELAETICDGLQSDKEKAYAISDWVYENIEKDIVVSIPSAVEVVRVRKGDCNEHTVLYVALARAVGVPCKTVIGIVHKDGMFFYHAWPAVYLGYWHHVDPTFGQHTADATHVQLLVGDISKQAELVNVVGKLKMEILEYR